VVRADLRLNGTAAPAEASKKSGIPLPQPRANARPATPPGAGALLGDPQQVVRSVQTVALFAAVSLAPAAALMVTAFVRINVVLVLLRQALGSPQVPGNQVLTALALLLTALVMRPVGERVYARAIEPFAAGRLTWSEAYREASGPVKSWMVGAIEQTRHERYLWALYDLAEPPAPGRVDPTYGDDFPMRVVAPAFLLSELTTALTIGFYLYLPFLVVDLVVSAVLAAMGMFMLPPSLVAMPLKLILFVLADGWLLVAAMLVQSFGTAGATP
jgi:flagellar biosynthetic protein FliP